MTHINSILVPVAYSVREVFGFAEAPDDLLIAGLSIPENLPEECIAEAEFLRAHIPAIDPDYCFRKDVFQAISCWQADSDNRVSSEVLHLFGPTGAGKTSAYEQYCARLGIPLFSAKGHKGFEPHEAFGHFIAGPNGESMFASGPVTLAASYGLPVLINEYDRIAPSRAIVFNDVFEGRPFANPGRHGEVVTPSPGFRVIVTTNTNMLGDTSGAYGTASAHDISVLERLHSIEIGYPAEEIELAIVESELAIVADDSLAYWFDQEGLRVGTDAGIKQGAAITRTEFASALVAFARKIRQQSIECGNEGDSALERTISTRTLRRLTKWAVRHMSAADVFGLSAVHIALDKVVAHAASGSTRVVMHQCLEACIGTGEKVSP
jgi:cobaltochelatase CobS